MVDTGCAPAYESTLFKNACNSYNSVSCWCRVSNRRLTFSADSLYFNFIYNNKNDDSIDVICKRFIKNAILESNFSNSNISSKEFKYDFKKFSPEDYDITDKNNVKSYIDNVMSSSQSLEKIR